MMKNTVREKMNNCFYFTFARFYAGFYCRAKD